MLRWQRFIISENTHEKQLNLAAEKKQNQPEAEEQGTPEEESMVTNTGDDAGQDVEKTEKDKLKEAKVCPAFMHFPFPPSILLVLLSSGTGASLLVSRHKRKQTQMHHLE